MFEKFLSASPGKLTHFHACCVCNQTLASICTKKLGIHNSIGLDSLQLVKAMQEAADTFASMSFVKVINSMWHLNTPKGFSDVIEALLGVVLIDSSYAYKVTREVVLRLLKEPLEYVHPQMADDPIHEFLKWVGRFGCGQVPFRLVIFMIHVRYLVSPPPHNRKCPHQVEKTQMDQRISSMSLCMGLISDPQCQLPTRRPHGYKSGSWASGTPPLAG